MSLKALAQALKLVKTANPEIVAALDSDAALDKAAGALHDLQATNLTREQLATVLWDQGNMHAGPSKEEIKTGPSQASSGGGAEKMVQDYSSPAPQTGVALDAEKLARLLPPMMTTMKAYGDAISTLLASAKSTSAFINALVAKAKDEEDEEEESEVVEINASKAADLTKRAEKMLEKAAEMRDSAGDEDDLAKRKSMKAEAKALRKSAARLLAKARLYAMAGGEKAAETRKGITAMIEADRLLKADINVVQEEEEEDEDEDDEKKAKKAADDAAAAAKAAADAEATKKAADEAAAAEAAKKAVTDTKGNQADHKDSKTGNQAGEAAKGQADVAALLASFTETAGKISKALEGVGMLQTNMRTMFDVISGKTRVGADLPELAKASTAERETKLIEMIRDREDSGQLNPLNALAAREIVQQLGMVRQGAIDATIVQARIERAPTEVRDLFKQAA